VVVDVVGIVLVGEPGVRARIVEGEVAAHPSRQTTWPSPAPLR
jgi:hypothetical protein